MPGPSNLAPWRRLLPALTLPALLAGCTSLAGHRAKADREALTILGEKQETVFGEKRPFTVDQPAETPATRLRAVIERAAGGEGQPPEPLQLDLEKTLEIAAVTSREFQNQKESLFLSALSLSSTRYDYGWTKLTLSGSYGVDGNDDDATSSGSARLSYSKRALLFGASILGSLLHNFSRTITGSDDWDTSSVISLGLTQPLLQGFGSHIALEGLTQAERDVIYDLRDFERYRRDLVVRLTSSYYSLLQRRDRIAIEEENIKNLEKSLARLEAMKKTGRTPKVQVDQTRQSVLRSKATLLSLKEALDGALDSFKITLGLPVAAEVELDMKEFEELQKKGIPARGLDQERCIAIALEERLDLKTTADKLADAGRTVVIAADNLKNIIDLGLDVDVPTKEGKGAQPDWKNATFGAGIDWSIPLDKTPQRNAYRSALISFERSKRDLLLREDTVRREIRSRLRSLAQIRQDYIIQQNSVALARERVEETETKQEMGRAIVRDVLEARESLVSAQSSLSSLILDYLTERLALLRDLEILKLDKKGLNYDAEIEHYSEFGKP